MAGLNVSSGTFAELGVQLLHDILKLRVDVFVVEQRCPYPEIDGRDCEPATRHYWIATEDGTVMCYLRLLDDGDVQRVGRVLTAAPYRGRGLTGLLLAQALADHDRETVLDAQAHLTALYEQHGFRVDGEPFIEDGIPHVPMRRRLPG